MTRTDQDSWDLASSVGATATMVAAARALASAEANPIIDGPFAAPLVRAVSLDFFTRLAEGEIDHDEQAQLDRQLVADSIAVRTRFFDDFFLDAARRGCASR
ncbi:leucine carboxyl methyltransferase family protein [Mycobacterium ulcerans str. Harvey]|uniref:Leucine carboxyl methyltransferase family protein n=1 Tax=Mycobacterium ulcerans str. Harvey TaxID=1299332 RepID=A0ABN0R4U5_MYCUL|nr:leucine carboxyl methyltransferase family protein [Mycobacterium ulcerans str. Harvey]